MVHPLQSPVQGIQGVHEGHPAVSHHIQYFGGRSNPPLVNGGGRGERGSRGIQ